MSSLEDIPKPLLKLLRLIMKGFYNIELKLIMDMLAKRRETKEDDLVDLLKFERKHLRSLIQQLKQDKFINVRLIMETGIDGKSIRHNYYSINYRKFVNVVKYKVHHMTRKLQIEERALTNRASYICQTCKKTYTDLEVGELRDFMSNEFRCSYCDGIVDEDPNVRPKTDSRIVLRDLYQQLEPIYNNLKESENINWSLIEADKDDLNAFNDLVAATNSNGPTNETFKGQMSEPLVKLVSNANNINEIHTRQNQLVNDFYNISIDDGEQKELVQNGHSRFLSNRRCFGDMKQENCEESVEQNSESSLIVNVGSTKVPFNKLTDEHIELMTPSQKKDYERLTRHIYYLVYD